MASQKKLAIIGIGRWGKNLLRDFSKVANVAIVVTNGGAENIQWLKENYPKVQHTVRLDDVLADQSIDALVIATPIATHFELAKKALKSGKDIFVEKPLTPNVEHAEQLYERARQANLVLSTDNILLFHPSFESARKIKGPKDAKFEWLKYGTFNEDIWVNLAYHDIYMALTLFGMPKNLKVIKSEGQQTEADIIEFEMRFDGGEVARSYINRVSQDETRHTMTLGNQKFDFGNVTHGVSPLELVCQDFIKRVDGRVIKDPSQDLVINTLGVIAELKKLPQK